MAGSPVPNGDRVNMGTYGNTAEASLSYTIHVSDPSIRIPRKFRLYQNHPNPFNPETKIKFTTENTEYTEIIIYNIKGQKVKLFSDLRNQSSVIWNGTDDNNKPVSSGIYFYKLKSGNYEKMRKMILLK